MARDSGSGSTLVRRLLGRELAALRNKAGMPMDEAKAVISVGKQTIWRMETGQSVRLRAIDIAALCKAYGASPEKTEILLALCEEAQGKGWWHAYGDTIPKHFEPFVGLEQAAERIVTYQSALIPGLLQTPEYRREVIWTEFPGMETAEVERRIELAARRQDRLTDSRNPLVLEVIMDELSLRRPVGGPSVMSAQLHHILEISTLPNVSVRVVPASAGTHPGLLVGTFVLLEFPRHPRAHMTEPPVIFVQGFTGALYLEKPVEVEQYRDAYTRLQRSALDEDASRRLILEIAEELAR
ncbi:helix-turn-helix domain-containing protein [Nocardia abscessus]|uniref:helix-turn-helix domain-containing protein n=1 Tax=Nocardia abscessus TaxID=120957 RepID=UPI001895A9C4|nr:helix-turn-helix transcriptional regulator [Nocardia abscessus]MBF6336034.1 helix-turn-helix domain-containing protein [Nocardia abscessus]